MFVGVRSGTIQLLNTSAVFELGSNPENNVDGKSIMQMSMLAATSGCKLTIRAEGPDAEEAIEALRELVEEKHFDEPTSKEKS